ncbi:hypothetical protein U0070_017256 [Myodes glareolus]|uniref:Uncharacterized protein n=1 Tax=Myodes glareolus TaxID=447135 RepID=A0AAW0K2P5_MYOGA
MPQALVYEGDLQSTLKEKKKRTAEKEDQLLLNGQENKRRQSPGEEVTGTVNGKQNSWTSPPMPGSSGQHKHKIQLLPSQQGDQLTLSPSPELGYSITAEHLDKKRKVTLKWFNKVLEDKTDDVSTLVAETPPATSPPFRFTLPAVAPAASPASHS